MKAKVVNILNLLVYVLVIGYGCKYYIVYRNITTQSGRILRMNGNNQRHIINQEMDAIGRGSENGFDRTYFDRQQPAISSSSGSRVDEATYLSNNIIDVRSPPEGALFDEAPPHYRPNDLNDVRSPPEGVLFDDAPPTYRPVDASILARDYDEAIEMNLIPPQE